MEKTDLSINIIQFASAVLAIYKSVIEREAQQRGFKNDAMKEREVCSVIF